MIFLKKKTLVLLKTTNLNKQTIKFQKNLQLPYKPIYNLSLVELKILKTHIETYFANGFIYSLKSYVGTLIFFVRKPDGSFWLYVNYQSLNNLIIKH